MIKQFLTQLGIPLFALFMLLMAIAFSLHQPSYTLPNLSRPPAISPFQHSIAGIGIIEPQNGTINVGSSATGIISRVYVETGSVVNAGDPLFKLDDSEINAQINLARVKLYAARLELDDILRTCKVTCGNILAGREKVAIAQADLAILTTRLNNLTVRAPVAGKVFNVNVKTGENVQMSAQVQPLITLGNSNKIMWVRVEIDETNLFQISPQGKAIGILKGKKTPIPLQYVKKDLLIAPKKNLIGGSNELVDTRVADIIYSFDNTKIDALPGQHMDVFIESTVK